MSLPPLLPPLPLLYSLPESLTTATINNFALSGIIAPSSYAHCSAMQLPAWLADGGAAPTVGHHHRPSMPPLHAPTALVLLSHYPFYTVYARFLQQLYRISLSEAPVPIERYISNFCCEVPLPPQGQVRCDSGHVCPEYDLPSV